MSHSRSFAVFLLLWIVLSITGCGEPLNSGGEDSSKPPADEVITNDNRLSSDDPVGKPLEIDPGLTNKDEPTVNGLVEDDGEKTEPAVQTIFRPSDRRPRFDDRQLAKLGILKYESKRLKLYTDIAPARAKPLPGLIDQAFDALAGYFGELPPDRERAEFQMTGYLMANPQQFRLAGLLPGNLPFFYHGRHRGAEFWMNDQKDDYYCRHLMIHEATHCFMTIVPTVNAPVWYLEGMAELFGTHVIDEQGKVTFRVMPHNKADFRGLGRITLLRTEVATERALSISEVTNLRPERYLKNEAYAWSWALCKFFDSHPRYDKRFRELGNALHGTPLTPAFREAYSKDLAGLMSEWSLFAHNLQDGYDNEHAAITFRPGTPLSVSEPRTNIEIKAARGWQSSGVRVQKGHAYEISAAGQFTLADKPKPWVSDAGGVSIRYFNGRPLGMLLATVRADVMPDGSGAKSMLDVQTVGRESRFTAPVNGTLYLRLNDSWSELADNTASVRVTVRVVPAEPTKN
jgi:hypothetical protein